MKITIVSIVVIVAFVIGYMAKPTGEFILVVMTEQKTGGKVVKTIDYKTYNLGSQAHGTFIVCNQGNAAIAETTYSYRGKITTNTSEPIAGLSCK